MLPPPRGPFLGLSRQRVPHSTASTGTAQNSWKPPKIGLLPSCWWKSSHLPSRILPPHPAARQDPHPVVPPARRSGVPQPKLPSGSGKMKGVQREGKQPAWGVRQEPAPRHPLGGRMLVLEGCLWGMELLGARLRQLGGPRLCSERLRWGFWRGLWQELVSSGHAEPRQLGHFKVHRYNLLLSWRVLGGLHLVHFTWTTSSFLKLFET